MADHVSWPVPIESVIFDVDGTLLDTERSYFAADEEFIGRPLPAELCLRLVGVTDEMWATLLIDHFHLPETPDSYISGRQTLLVDKLRTSPYTPGAQELVAYLHNHHVPLAAGTGALKMDHEVKVSNHQEVFRKIDVMVTVDDVAEGKPAPDIFLKGMETLSISDPETVLVVEDSPPGVLAANRAGMPMVMVPDYRVPRDEIVKGLEQIGAKPTLIADSLSEFPLARFLWDARFGMAEPGLEHWWAANP